MLNRIIKSRSFKGISLMLALTIFFECVAPMQALALTGGPSQPEFNSFTPIGVTDMVDLSSGDMSYNIPLMDVGGYPLNIAYASGISMDQEASWVGLGWNLSVGQINRNVRGIPDDFKGDNIKYENYSKPNVTAGASFKFTPAAFGFELNDLVEGGASVGMTATYNSYTGFSLKPSVGVNLDLGEVASVGFNAESGPDGMNISPSLSLHTRSKEGKQRSTQLGLNFGASFNSRQGLSNLSVSADANHGDEQTRKYINNVLVMKNAASVGSNISFVANTYTPTKRTGMVTGSFTVNAALGMEVFGAEGQGQITAYGTVMKVRESELEKDSPSYGYANTQYAGQNAILDFNREKDGVVTKNTTNLALTNYSYDTYSIQGQGVSGMYRPYRSQVGYVYDPEVTDWSGSGTVGLEFGSGNTAHFGVDVQANVVKSSSGMWSSQNKMSPKLQHSPGTRPDYETVYYKNVGDLSVDQDFGMFDQTGRYKPMHVNIVGWQFFRKADNEFRVKPSNNTTELSDYHTIDVPQPIKRTHRAKRNQSIVNITKGELNQGIGYGPCVNRATTNGPEVNLDHGKAHHIAEVQITRNDGARYIYGLPAYNTIKKEVTFSVDGSSANCAEGTVDYDPSLLTNKNTWKNLPNDRSFDRTTTPEYVHTHLLTSVLSTDYQDIDNNGPTPNDLGSYTKFSYKKPSEQDYKWRVPYLEKKASFNEGLKTNPRDDKANYVYGEKEQYYIDKIETKTHVALFKLKARHDAKGVDSEAGGQGASRNTYALEEIHLFSIEEYDGLPLDQTLSTPIKVVHFEYDFELCQNIPTNDGQPVDSDPVFTENQGGKLTLKKIYFTYRNSLMGKYTGYDFTYSDVNPDYNLKAYDSWGNYKPNNGGCNNLDPIGAMEFPFTNQNKTEQDLNAEAWSLKTIDLPSGGQINIEYESDDYGYVQNKKAMRMFKVVGAGNSKIPTINDGTESDILYSQGPTGGAKKYLYVELDEGSNYTYGDYVDAIKNSPIMFRFFMNMTELGASSAHNGKFDYVTGYFEYEEVNDDNGYDGDGITHSIGNKRYLSIPVKVVDLEGGVAGQLAKVNPISKAAWHFGRKYLNDYVYSSQPNSSPQDQNGIQQIVTQMVSPGILNNLIDVFKGPNGALKTKGIGKRFIKDKSWVRLMEPSGSKLGGGCRVKTVKMSDVWNEMTPGTDYHTMNYGQKYKYTLEDTTLSSGVATYEPVGNKENPFVQPVFSETKKLLAPDEQNFIEKPFGEMFFPSPTVTYSRVEVANLTAGENAGMFIKQLHKTGSVVSEFYTSKDYPTIVNQTKMDAHEDKTGVLGNLLKLTNKTHFTATQGYVIHLNDMNGKQKAQWVFAQGQSTAISGVEYKYDDYESSDTYNANHLPELGKGRLNNVVKVINEDGSIEDKAIGVEVDIVNDFRRNKTFSTMVGINVNLAGFMVGPILVPVPLGIPDVTTHDDKFRSVVTTKVVNTFGLLKETIAYDAGASVSTRNLAWDASTGEVLLTETVDEYNDKYFTLNYPAHWYYKGMAQASLNASLTGVLGSGSSSGYYTMENIAGYSVSDFILPGDELYLSGSSDIAWVDNVQGNQFHLIDRDGNEITTALGNSFKIVRSGHRNLQSAGIMNVTLMRNPLLNANGSNANSLGSSFLASNNWANWRIINAGAVDYSDYWKAQCECDLNTTGIYNPYLYNERGVWRTKSSRTYLTGRNKQDQVTPRMEGFFTSFSPMYKLSQGNNWYKDFEGWTFVAEVSKYSPYGFELENTDALNRFSAAQYGYNNTFPMAVGANTEYFEIGFDGFEDYGFDGCPVNAHFNFRESIGSGNVTTDHSHTGKHSYMIPVSSRTTLNKVLDCDDNQVQD